ncbi:UDP-xylose and UDP-N-acetylglucosamine transporter-like [Halichondria panicea]|uniref:UDP-xylose and UDP-N-acetylglucosamine transporter-like n=1 Tax=Halichondria panicea TaxID=6063 RepID=UPI00312B6F3D
MELKLTLFIAISLVFLGCCSNVVFLELIIKDDPGAGNIITFFQFLFVSLEGVVFVSHFFRVRPVIPIRKYIFMVMFYFFVSIVNNYALNFNVPLPLHMIFRSGSLVANMVMGILILKKSYSASKYVAVFMIFVGISLATFASAQYMNGESSDEGTSSETSYTSIVTMTIGIVMLLTALFGSARMGIFQELLYKEHGKHPREAMFYTHALPLPAFLILGTNIWSRIISFSASEPISLVYTLTIPKMWFYVICNCITQYVCIRGVFVLTTECPSLIVTLVVTLRKFVSLVFSIFYFNNPFTITHWLATLLVFSGTALFTGVFNPLLDRLLPKMDNKTKKE